MSDILKGLNDAQAAAVSASLLGSHLVLAGAGSGKTRVLTRRVAWLCEQGIPLHGMVAVTFTNKAAAEMKGRLIELLGEQARGMWIGTFHGLSHRILRLHPREVGLPEDFQILDADDQIRLMKQVMEEMETVETISAKDVCSWLSRHKDDGLRPGRVPVGSVTDEVYRSLYMAYQERCDRLGLVDFAEILLRCKDLFDTCPALLSHYRSRFGHLLIDEFQDTNTVQYDWVCSLLGSSGNGFVVADDAQAIYGWRGARVDNVLRFVDEYKASIWRLEQNYRSTSAILDAANTLIANNPVREDFKKKLWSSQEGGEPIKCVEVKTEMDEAEKVAGAICAAISHGIPASQCAILYRSNAQSRVLEEALLARSLPYRIYGGHRFFERQEIKDALAYLRLSSNKNDDIAWDRVINTPPRGIGSTTVDEICSIASKNDCSRWEACHLFLSDTGQPSRARSCVQAFVEMMDALAWKSDVSLADQVKEIILSTGLRAHHHKLSKGEANSRADNLDELVSVAARFQQPQEDIDAGISLLHSFLAQSSLDPDSGGKSGKDAKEDLDQVQLMTIHSAKGLEFEVVFLVGWEEGYFPSTSSSGEEGRIEEERRLAYVAITRAKKKLAILHAKSRCVYGRIQEFSPSRFLLEISDHLAQKSSSQNRSSPSKSIQAGKMVAHPSLGKGVVLRMDDNGRVLVAFSGHGARWLDKDQAAGLRNA